MTVYSTLSNWNVTIKEQYDFYGNYTKPFFACTDYYAIGLI